MPASESDRRAALEALRNAQFVVGMSRLAKKQVLGDPRQVKALRERLDAMRTSVRALSEGQREKLNVPWTDLEAIDTGSEAVWKAAKRATPKLMAELTPLVSDEPEAAFLIAPPTRGRKGATEEPEPERITPKEAPKPKRALTDKERAELDALTMQRVAAEESYVSWLRDDKDLASGEWRNRRSEAERARRAEDAYIEKLLKARSRK